jgi:hypothetical protein
MLRSLAMTTSPTPQFATAEYVNKSGSETCKSCNAVISSRYYKINGELACETCAEILQRQSPADTHKAFVRGLTFGVGGAIVGLILYSAFTIITHMYFGYISLAVGYIVGIAIMKGSRGIGGLRYQIAAALLTYAAVSMAAIPIGIAQYLNEDHPKSAQVQPVVPPNADDPAQPGNSTAPSSAPAEAGSDSTGEKTGALALLGTLLFAGLASPFLALQDSFHGIIGLVILFVGIRIAWQKTEAKPLDLIGPFNKAAPPAPAAG